MTNTITKKQVVAYMLEHFGDYVDKETGEINMTLLAEGAYSHMIDDDKNVPEVFFDAAFDVFVMKEKVK